MMQGQGTELAELFPAVPRGSVQGWGVTFGAGRPRPLGLGQAARVASCALIYCEECHRRWPGDGNLSSSAHVCDKWHI